MLSLLTGYTPKNLLHRLLFLNSYANDHNHAALCCITEDAFRKWAWTVAIALSKLGLLCYQPY